MASAALASLALLGCSSVDPYDTTCQDLGSPDTLREVGLKLAKDDVQAKVRYEQEIERICADAPGSFKPAQQVKPEE